MQKWKFTCILLVVSVFGMQSVYAQNPALVKAYIDEYKDMAMAEQIRVGIPAAITLAQGIHETGAGTSELAVKGNNHFGIKCKRGWTGQSMKHTDDRPNECFRKYSSAAESYTDHSDYLKNNPRYATLFTLSTTDYAAWAMGLRRAGYATNPKYAQVLIALIEDYKLQEYTYAALDNNPYSDTKYAKGAEVVPNNDNGNNNIAKAKAPVTPMVQPPTPTVVQNSVSNSGITVQQQVPILDSPAYGKVIKVNGLRAIYARKGESPLEYAIRNSIRYNRFLEMNDLKDEPVPADMYLYLERKHFKGTRPMHMVKPGETMLVVAQAEGVQLKSLLEMNLLSEGEEALPGTTLELQRKATTKPKTWAGLQDDNKAAQGAVTSSPKTQTTGYVATNKSNNTTTNMAVDYVHNTSATQTVSTTTNVVSTTPIAPPPPASMVDSQKNELDELKNRFDNVLYADNKTQTKPTVPVDAPPPMAVVKKDTVVVRKVVVPANNTNSTPKVVTTDVPKPVVVAPVTVDTKDDKATVKTRPVTPITRVVSNGDTSGTAPAENVEEEEVVVADMPDEDLTQVAQQPKQPVTPTPATPLAPATVPTVDTPLTELDRLKQQFDRSIYSGGSTTKTTTEPAQKPQTNITSVANNAGKPLVDPSKYYTVKKGDTAFSIAKKHNISMSQLMDWNDLDFGPIKEGMKLKVKE